MTLAIIMTFSLMAFPVSADSEVKELGLCKGDNVNAKLNALMETDADTQWEYLAKTYEYKTGNLREHHTETFTAWAPVDGGTVKDVITGSEYSLKKWQYVTVVKDVTYPSLVSLIADEPTVTVRVVGTDTTYSVKVVDGRIQSVIAVNENAAVTYNMDKSVMQQAILANAVDLSASTLPADAVLTVSGADNLNASEEAQTVTISFAGNDYYKPCQVNASVIVNKANVTVTLKGNVNDESSYVVMTAGGDFPEGFVTLDPNDPSIDIWKIFAGRTNDNVTIAYVDLPASYKNEALIAALDFIFPFVREDGKTFSQVVNDGMTVAEFKALMQDLLDAYNWAQEHKDDTMIGSIPTPEGIIAIAADKLMPDSIATVAEQIVNLPEFLDDVTVALGTPSHAGVYAVLVVTDSENYNAAYGFGGVVVVPNMRGNELVWNYELPESLTADELASADLTATLYNNGQKVKDAKISYKYTGSYKIFFGLIKVKYNSSDVPTRVGSYTQVATCYSGDNISILPATRSFNIVEATDSKAVVSEPVEAAAAPAEVEDVIENVVDSAVAEAEDAVNVPENEEAAAPAEQPAEDVVAPAEPAAEEEIPAAPAEDEAPAGEEAEADKGFSVIGSITEPVFGILNKGLSGLGKLF